MTTLLILLALYILAMLCFLPAVRNAPTDTDLWGPKARLMDLDAETRRQALTAHPELARAIEEYRAASVPDGPRTPQAEEETEVPATE